MTTQTFLKCKAFDLPSVIFYSNTILHALVMCISVFVQVWEGLDVVKTARKMLGETNPADSLPGTIRGDYCVEVGR